MLHRDPLPSGARALFVMACAAAVVAALRAGAPILVPLAFAGFVTIVSLPVLGLFIRLGIPRSAAIPLVLAADLAVLTLVGLIATQSAEAVRESLPAYLGRLQELEIHARAALEARGLTTPGAGISERIGGERLLLILSAVLVGATGIMSRVFLILLLTGFMLAETRTFPHKAAHLLGDDSPAIARLRTMASEIQRYLALKTLVSLITGLAIGWGTWALGVDFPLLWGLLAFVLNYIPNVGSVLAAVPALAVALLQGGPGLALATGALFLGANVVLGSIVEPHLLGRQVGISTLAVLLSLLFWGWAWGPAGMFLALPLTMALRMVLDHHEDLRWLSVLLSSTSPDLTARPAPDTLS
jgi:AI-2 transport protein TqsA